MTILGFRKGWLARLAAIVTAALLAAGTMPAWAATPASAPPATALQVASEPDGASVYLDGELKGATPLTIEGVASGEHTVRLVKDGFLENSRSVSVPAAGRSLLVRLTRAGAPSPERGAPASATPRAEPDQQKGQPKDGTKAGGGKRKWLWITLGAVGLAVLGGGGYFLLKNDPPKIADLTATPSRAFQGLTEVVFGATVDDEDKAKLTYAWSFGDGESSTDARPTHIYSTSGDPLTVSLSVTDAEQQTTTQTTSVTVKSMAGSWSGVVGGIRFTCVLTQNGSRVGGSYADQYGSAVISGSVSKPDAVTISALAAQWEPLVMRGTLGGDFDTVSGTATGLVDDNDRPVTVNFTMTRQQ